jgi:NAD(P)-dependent dehydrogenase (short-subunit alcohol dehydrogenase family)
METPQPTGRLSGSVAIVTGGASGIGRAVCEALAQEGATVVIADLDAARVEEAVRAVDAVGAGGQRLGEVVDIREERSIEEMAQRTLDRFGQIDILVAAAGILRGKGRSPRPMVQISLDEWNDVIGTNLRGTFLTNRAVLPVMIRQKSGQIVNISSTSGRKGRAFDSVYCASKFGVIGFSESLAKEVEHYGIKVHVILPDAVNTPLWQQNGPIPCPPGALTPARVAQVIMFLLLFPRDAIVPSPVIVPFRGGGRHAELS